MDVREWALILYTILIQMAVGSFVVLSLVRTFAARKAGPDEADRMVNGTLYIIIPAIVLGVLASFFHLGNPANAPRAITNLATSWLSREIIFTLLFGGLAVIFAGMQWFKIGSPGLRSGIAWAASLSGLVLVYSMGNIYRLETQPAWNSAATPLLFFVTTFLLGALAMGAAFVANYAVVKRREPECAGVQCRLLQGTVRSIAIAALVLMGVELIVAPLQVALLADSGLPAAVGSAGLLGGEYGGLYALRLALLFIGAGVFGVFMYVNAQSAERERVMGSLVYGAFGLVLASEIVGRFLFYAASLQITI